MGRATNPGLSWGTVETVAADARGLFMRNFFFICSGVIAVSGQGVWGRLGVGRLLYCGGVRGLHW